MIETRTIFVVVGETGEYSDRRDWLVAAYDNEGGARKRVEVCDADIRTLVNQGWQTIDPNPHGYCYNTNRELDDVYDPTDPRWPKSPSDPKMEMMSGEVVYVIEEVEFHGGQVKYANHRT